MTDRGILLAVQATKRSFGVKCSKMSGAVTVEIIRAALAACALRVSPRDVYVSGVPVEFDLLIPKHRASPMHGVIYHPREVLAVLEIKNSGSFGEGTLAAVRHSFELVRRANRRIYCAYVTLAERKGFKWAATKENIGADAYTLFWLTGSEARRTYEATGDWDRLANTLTTALEEHM